MRAARNITVFCSVALHCIFQEPWIALYLARCAHLFLLSLFVFLCPVLHCGWQAQYTLFHCTASGKITAVCCIALHWSLLRCIAHCKWYKLNCILLNYWHCFFTAVCDILNPHRMYIRLHIIGLLLLVEWVKHQNCEMQNSKCIALNLQSSSHHWSTADAGGRMGKIISSPLSDSPLIDRLQNSPIQIS